MNIELPQRESALAGIPKPDSGATAAEPITGRPQLVAKLQREMFANSSWVRIHAAEGLLDNGESEKIADLFRPEADSAAAPYRIGVWRILARATGDGEREHFVGRIRAVLSDPAAPDRLSAVESLCKLGAVSRDDREMILAWLASANDVSAPFLHWLLLLAGSSAERETEEAALAGLLGSDDTVVRLRAAYALGRLPELAPHSIAKLRAQLAVEPPNSIARLYFITALLLRAPAAPDTAGWLPELFRYLHGRPNEQLEAGIVTGRLGRQVDLAMLRPLLNNAEPDARIGAAGGMLKLLK